MHRCVLICIERPPVVDAVRGPRCHRSKTEGFAECLVIVRPPALSGARKCHRVFDAGAIRAPIAVPMTVLAFECVLL